MRVLFVDCYDSFTHNLVHGLAALGAEVEVVCCDRTSPEALLAAAADRVVLGPGPGRPEEAGCLVPAVRLLAGRVPVLGVCLGHQAIGMAYGARVVRHRLVHGHATPIRHDGTGLFRGVPVDVAMTRYHSLVVEPGSLPSALEPVAFSDDGAVQALRHRELPVHGVQFHPESVLSGDAGLTLLGNFLLDPWIRPRRAAAGDRAPA